MIFIRLCWILPDISTWNMDLAGIEGAARDKTIAFPVEGVLYYSDPRFLLALILFTILSLIDLIIWRR
ncbi:MAG: hypothetical protein U5O39_06740 [Gammaproteobacteria bacterium]|nr:hypothetical protein [Gammaproteobacteria bacterium]